MGHYIAVGNYCVGDYNDKTILAMMMMMLLAGGGQ
jgi:hypothetical protein